MSTKDELYAMAAQLKEYCKSKTFRVDGELDCTTDCVFRDGFDCLIAEVPSTWRVRKFTAEDIALAKALKAFGVNNIYRIAGDLRVRYRDKDAPGGPLPTLAFECMRYGESVSIDDIIAEEE